MTESHAPGREPLVRSFASLQEAEAAREALAAAGIARELMELTVLQDEAGPVEGNFVIGNGETTHGRAPDAVRTGPEVPYDENFREPAYRGNFLLILGGLDAAQRASADAVLDRFKGRAVTELAGAGQEQRS